jgi:hypothetical protein
MADLADLRRDLQRLIDNSEPMRHAVGQFAKEAALDAAAKDLGADRAFSGWRRKVSLGAGYDLGNPVVLNLRPAGMWFLAEDGRKRTKRIFPKKRGGKKAVMTPRGPRAYSTSKRSRGLHTLTDAENAINKGIVKAAENGLNEMTRKVFG